MAGESPDKSEQRKSPGVTPGTSDPRLAVFRSVPDPEAASVSGSQSGDARLRAAVAAWVATADSPSGEGVAEADSPSGEAAVPEARVLPQASAPAGTGTDAPSGGSAPADPSSAPDGAGADAEDAPAAPVAAGGAAEPSIADEARTAASTVAVAVAERPGSGAGANASAAGSGAGDAATAGRADGTGQDDEAEAVADDEAVVADDDAAGSERNAAAAEDGATEAGGDDGAVADGAASGPAGDGLAGDGAASSSATADEADAGPDAADEPDAAEGDAGPDAEEDVADVVPGAGDDVADATDAEDEVADAVPGADGDADGPGHEPRGADGEGGDAPADGTDAGETANSKVASAKATDATGATRAGAVDQPTGVFRRPKQPVDRPTTTLKRSTFVPLRPDDVPADTKKPEPTWPATAKPEPAAVPAAQPHPLERTRQQPLPPRPPLDLLAELTNTPPPPQTPARTLLRRFKIWTPLAVILVIIFAIAQAVRPLPTPEIGLSVAPAYTFKGGALQMPWPDEGQSAVEVDGVGSLGTHGNVKPAPTASMAKVMTAYVVLRDHPLSGKKTGPKITVDKKAGDEANSPDESTAPIKEGQRYTERQMLELLMIPSGNNAARLLSRWDGPTKDFVKKMNDAAADLGMNDTTYTDPSGLTATTVSTATDQLKLARAVMRNDVFREIVNTPQIDIPGIPNTIYNNNRLLLKPGVSGVKTGSSTPAGGNLLWAADTVIDGTSRRIVGVVMGQTTGTTLDSKLQRAIDKSYELIQAAQRDVTSATVVKKGEVVGYVDDGLGGRTPVVATKNLKAIGWPGLRTTLKIGDGGSTVPHSAKAGTVVGEVTVGSGPGKVTAPVALQQDLAEPGFGDKLTRLG